MSERSEDPNLSDIELDAFLDELKNDESRSKSGKSNFAEFISKANDELAGSGYEPLTFNSDHYLELYELLFGQLTQRIAYDEKHVARSDYDQVIDQQVRELIDLASKREATQIGMIEARTAAMEGYKITDAGLEAVDNWSPPTPDQLTAGKKQLLADLIINEHLNSESSIYTYFDRFVPGGHVDPKSDDMLDYYLISLDTDSRLNEEKNELQKLIEQTYQIAGIEATSTDQASQEMRFAISRMVESALDIDTDSRPNSRAQMIETMYEIARSSGIDASKAKDIVDFIESEFPPTNTL